MSPVWIIAIFVGVGLLLLAARILLRPSVLLIANPVAIEVLQYETEAVAFVLRRRLWRGGRWRDVGGGYLLKPRDGAVFSVDPPRGASHPLNSIFPVSVTGVVPGQDELVVSATAEGESKACVRRVSVLVLPNADGERRIRQSAASLRAK